MLRFYPLADADALDAVQRRGLPADGATGVCLYTSLDAAEEATTGPVLVVDATALGGPVSPDEDTVRVPLVPPTALQNVDPYRPPHGPRGDDRPNNTFLTALLRVPNGPLHGPLRIGQRPQLSDCKPVGICFAFIVPTSHGRRGHTPAPLSFSNSADTHARCTHCFPRIFSPAGL